MVRLAESTAKWIALFIRAFNPTDQLVSQILERELRFFRNKEDRGEEFSSEEAALYEFVLRFYDGVESVPSRESLILNLIGKGASSSVEPKLIDAIIETLQKPLAREILAGKDLKNLRKALLTHEELLGIDERIKKAHLHCGSCQKPFQNGEMGTIRLGSSTDGRSLDWTFYCSRCSMPEYAACQKDPKCEGSVHCPKRFEWLRGGRLDCGKHKPGEKAEEVVEAHQVDLGGVPPPPGDMHNWRVQWNAPRAARGNISIQPEEDE